MLVTISELLQEQPALHALQEPPLLMETQLSELLVPRAKPVNTRLPSLLLVPRAMPVNTRLPELLLVSRAMPVNTRLPELLLVPHAQLEATLPLPQRLLPALLVQPLVTPLPELEKLPPLIASPRSPTALLTLLPLSARPASPENPRPPAAPSVSPPSLTA